MAPEWTATRPWLTFFAALIFMVVLITGLQMAFGAPFLDSLGKASGLLVGPALGIAFVRKRQIDRASEEFGDRG
ncbi:hypothetical protein JJV70_13395 [Streptomyces sp. JJ66]|uniref:hypothetical protein n=1 Tax=Streptomyces sp. JJ66 TaxID=2803843 RepID=UPI001C580498|nr:hypothetical protein [Streptomyces sp. JJ66]MBW1603083.1 hypothetical protein [Streptomyces sp. JJ66]